MFQIISFKTCVASDRNPTPRELISKWAKENRIPISFGPYGEQHVSMYGNLYAYDHWRVTPRQTDSLIYVELSRI